MKDEKKVVTISLVPDLPVGTVFVFNGKKQKYEVVAYDSILDSLDCSECAFQWSNLENEKERSARYLKCASFRCSPGDRKDELSVKAVKVRSSRRGKEV